MVGTDYMFPIDWLQSVAESSSIATAAPQQEMTFLNEQVTEAAVIKTINYSQLIHHLYAVGLRDKSKKKPAHIQYPYIHHIKMTVTPVNDTTLYLFVELFASEQGFIPVMSVLINNVKQVINWTLMWNNMAYIKNKRLRYCLSLLIHSARVADRQLLL